MFRAIRFFLSVLFILAFVVFAVVNREPVTISLFPFPYSAEMPLFMLAIACFGLGVLVAAMLSMLNSGRIRRLYSAERKRAMALENELEGVKAAKSPSSDLTVT